MRDTGGARGTFDTVVSPDGLARLGPYTSELRADLDRAFAAWGISSGAGAASYPPLVPVKDLARLDYFVNFPHLASLVAGFDLEAAGPAALGALGSEPVAGDLLAPAGHALPSAACYSVYLGLGDTDLDGPVRVTTSATCFRREQRYEGLRRLRAFTMREIVCVGEREAVLDHLAAFKARLTSFLGELGLPVAVEAASDPFFDPGGGGGERGGAAGRALMAKLFPVKEEFVYDGSLAIASVNSHRNFFGERCGIRLPDGSPAFSGCVAFGLERWIAALCEHFDGDLDRAREALAACSDWGDAVRA
jgi:hypothetical protein